MSKQRVFRSMVAAVAVWSVFAPGRAGPRMRAVVADLEVKVQNVTTTVATPSGDTSVVSLDLQQPTEFGSGLTEMLITALVESGRFIVLDRTVLDNAAKEHGAQVLVKGAVTELSFKRSGGGANLVSEIVDGSVVRSVATVTIDLRIIDIDSGRILDSVAAVGKVGSKLMSLTLKKEDIKIGGASFDNGPLGHAVRAAIKAAVTMIQERTATIPWEARVAGVETEDDGIVLYLNAGVDTGLEVGDLLEVYRAGTPITDPETGRVIGRTRGTSIGKCKIISVESNLSVAKPVDGAGFTRDDVVRRLP